MAAYALGDDAARDARAFAITCSLSLAISRSGKAWLARGEPMPAQAARRVTVKDANEKLVHRRLTVLELAGQAVERGGAIVAAMAP